MEQEIGSDLSNLTGSMGEREMTNQSQHSPRKERDVHCMVTIIIVNTVHQVFLAFHLPDT